MTLLALHTGAPPERLAAVRILSGGFAVTYLVVRGPQFLALRDRDGGGFDGVGPLAWLDRPVADELVTGTWGLAVVAGVAFVLGARFVVTGPLFALATLALTTYRASWGQLLWFDNLVVLHLLVLGVAASADAWSLDARRRRGVRRGRDPDYRGPLVLLCVIVVTSYVIAGVAKLRYGGTDWIAGDTLANHIAFSATRLEVLGGWASPLAGPAVSLSWALPAMAAASVAIELGAPVALLGGRWRTTWVAAAWAMHAAIAALMFVVFPYPLFLVAFAPFFAVERPIRRAAAWARNVALRIWASSRASRPGECENATMSDDRLLAIAAEPAIRALVGELCDRYGIAELAMFGSRARGDSAPESDLDLLYTLAPGRHLGFAINQLEDELSDLIGCRVDLVSKASLHRMIRQDVLAESQVLYAA